MNFSKFLRMGHSLGVQDQGLSASGSPGVGDIGHPQ